MSEREHEIDPVLRHTLTDDLPETTAELLRVQMRQAWRDLAVGASATRRPQRALLTAAALLLAVGGTVSHLVAPPRLLAESLSAQRTAGRVARQLRRVVGMECSLRVLDGDGPPLRYDVQWRSSGETEVRASRPGAVFRTTLLLPEERASLIGLTLERSRPTAIGSEEASLLPIRDYLAPGRIVDLLAGRWSRTSDPRGERPGTATFSVSAPRPIRVTIDTQTYLPLRLEAGGRALEGTVRVRAQFEWTSGPDPLNLLQGLRVQERL